MSYNITTWKTKKLDGLTISLELLTKYNTEMHKRGWQNPPIKAAVETKGLLVLVINPIESGTISGKYIVDGQIEIASIYLAGEASGTYYHEILLPVLKESKGILDAVIIWEGGDSITQLFVNDGKVEEGIIEL